MITNSISGTKLLYLEDTYQSEHNATVTSTQEVDGKGTALILDQTIFYPQGGGQPADQGKISNSNGGCFIVKDVRLIDGIVYHFGQFIQGTIAPDEKVTLTIEMPRRLLHARLHSAGHLIDAAVQSLGLPLTPTKGYHFPDGPYVEYLGEIAADGREDIRLHLEQKVNELINSQFQSEIITTSKAELAELCSSVPHYVSEDKPVRVVTFVPKLGCPCGGTHVKNSEEIKEISLTKLRVKSGQTRISYKLI